MPIKRPSSDVPAPIVATLPAVAPYPAASAAPAIPPYRPEEILQLQSIAAEDQEDWSNELDALATQSVCPNNE